MFRYYLALAIRNLRRNTVLTGLMIAAVGIGIGASMTMLTTLRAMSGDPIPDKSSKLFMPQIDSCGPQCGPQLNDWLPDQLTYRDAMNLLRAAPALRQTAMYAAGMDVDPGSGRPFQAVGRAATANFFGLFDVPFAEGAPWSADDDVERTNVVVLSAGLADRLFRRADAVGRTVNLDGRDYRVVGVLRPWNPTPRFYDVSSHGGGFGDAEDFYLPLATAIDRQLDIAGSMQCASIPPAGWTGLLGSECIWLQFWVELPTAGAQRAYRKFLDNYAAEQRRSGPFGWLPRVELHDVNSWLVKQNVVPEQVRVDTLVGIGFLAVCMINAVGLMLAKFGSRIPELGIRRALGASRADIFLQCLAETLIVGLAGGVLGLCLTAVGLTLNRTLQTRAATSVSLETLTRLDGGMLIISLTVAVMATLSAGLYPAWRASRVQLGWQIKAQ